MLHRKFYFLNLVQIQMVTMLPRQTSELASYFNGGNEGDMLINKDSNPPEEFILRGLLQ